MIDIYKQQKKSLFGSEAESIGRFDSYLQEEETRNKD
jgi:hypothetical protein